LAFGRRYPFFDFVPANNSATDTRSDLAIRRKFRIATFRSPRSTEPMNLRIG
jgi:hypothetical protein